MKPMTMIKPSDGSSDPNNRDIRPCHRPPPFSSSLPRSCPPLSQKPRRKPSQKWKVTTVTGRCHSAPHPTKPPNATMEGSPAKRNHDAAADAQDDPKKVKDKHATDEDMLDPEMVVADEEMEDSIIPNDLIRCGNHCPPVSWPHQSANSNV